MTQTCRLVKDSQRSRAMYHVYFKRNEKPCFHLPFTSKEHGEYAASLWESGATQGEVAQALHDRGII